jgi:Ribbon-helix-helix protein, copG family
MDDVDSESERVQLMVRFEKDLLDWLKREKRRSGRSMSWMIENAVNQWRDRLEKGRKTE